MKDESAFKHRLVYLLKSKLASEDGVLEQDLVFMNLTNPAFLFFETCMRSDTDSCLEWTRQVFVTFCDSFPVITRNILICLHFYLKFYYKKMSQDQVLVARMMLLYGLTHKKYQMRLLAANGFRAIPDRETLRILGSAFNKEKNDKVKSVMRDAIASILQRMEEKKREEKFLVGV